MNRLLRRFILPKILNNNYATFSTTANTHNQTQAAPQQQEVQVESQAEVQQQQIKTDYKAEYSVAQLLIQKKGGIDPKDIELMLQNFFHQDIQNQQYIAEDGWNKVAPHLISNNQTFVSPNNRGQFAKQKLREYQASLSPGLIKKFQQRIYNEYYYKSRQAQLFMRRLNPVSENYLKQGYYLLNSDSFIKLIQNKKHKIIRQLLQYGVFQKIPAVDFSLAAFVIQNYKLDKRNEYLLNLLVFNEYLFDQPITKQVTQAYAQKIDVFLQIQQLIYVSKHLNKLRLLWSYHKLYVTNINYSKDILAELYKTYIKTDSNNQEAVKKEIHIILNGHYQKSLLDKFFNRILKNTHNYNDFLKVYGITLILLSKLRAIRKILSQKDSNQLHPVFQLIQLNLPKQISDILFENILQLLSNQNHSRIEYQNFKRSYNFWLKDYTQPQRTIYHSQLSKLLQNQQNNLTLYYEGYINSEQYAKSIITLNRNKVQPKQQYRTKQIQVINNILKRNYQPVLNNFITTFHFGANMDLSKRFTQKLKETDKNKQFYNKQEESLYKLKLAHQVFLNRTLPNPLGEIDLQENHKENYYNIAIMSDEQLDYEEDLCNFQSQYRLNMGENIISRMADLQMKQEAKSKSAEQQIVEEVQPALMVSQPIGEEGQIQSLQTEVIVQQPIEPQQPIQAVQQPKKPSNLSAMNNIQDIEFLLSYNFDLSEIKQMFQKQSLANKKINVIEDDEQFSSQNDFQKEDKKDISQSNRQFHIKTQYQRQPEDDSEVNQIRSQPKKFFKKIDNIDQQRYSNVDSQDISQKIIKEAITEEIAQKKDNQSSFQKGSKRTKLFKKTNKFEFCTINTIQKVQDEHPDNIFTIQKINELKTQKIDKSLLKMLKQQQHIPSIGSGATIAKYLFLNGKNNSKKITSSTNKTLNIEFTSVIGTHSKNYQKYLINNLYNYELESQFYQDLLEDQLQTYNRLHFKQIIAHIINFKTQISDKIIESICKIAIKERIGYTFVQIAHLIKQNKFKLSTAALATVARTWQKFDILNEDLLNFIRQYCRKYDLSIRRQYYELFCKSLIKSKKFDKLQLIISAILIEIQPKPFKLQSHMINLKRQQITILQKEWKAKEQQKYIQQYLQIIDVIVTNLDQYIPQFYADIFTQYRRIKPVLNEKELGYAFICYSWKKEKIQELLEILKKQTEKGTSFMYDCLLKSFLNNFQELQDISQKMIDATVVQNRIKLSNEQIKKSLIIFKKSLTSNAFSKFLEHCLRFQEDINKLSQIKREMYYILNNNVEDVSVGGIFNLLDFIYNQKRQKERVEYREIKLSEEEKERKLLEIQKNVTKATQSNTSNVQNANTEGKGKKKQKQSKKQSQEVDIVKVNEQKQQKSQTKQVVKSDKKQVVSKKQLKKTKKLKSQQKLNKNQMVEQMITERDTNKQKYTNALQNDQEIVNQIKSQSIKNQSYKRKNIKSMSSLYDAALEIDKEEEEQRAKQLQKKEDKGKDSKGSKGNAKKGDDKKGKK